MLLIRFLIITICVLWLIRTLARLFLPMLFQSMVNKATQQHTRQYQQQAPKPAEGKVKVDFIPPSPKNAIPDNEGDFVDYEEVK